MSLFTLFSTPSQAQDLIARQAPTDRRMQVVDTLQLQQLLDKEYSGLPASELYEDWENVYAHRATSLPDSFRIDLRDFCMPTPSRVLTSNYGARWGRMHKGLDIKVYIGDTIRAAFSGKVRIVRYEGRGYGKYIVIRHDNGLETIYGHLSKQLVRENQDVRAGDVIGLGGNTGRSTGSHLHFETRLCGVALNPALLFDFYNQDVVGDFYVFHKRTYEREGRNATRLRGVRNNGSYSPEMVGSTRARAAASQKATKRYGDTPVAKYHKVQKGETLYSISRKRGVSVKKLCDMNHLGMNTRLKAGQIVRYI